MNSVSLQYITGEDVHAGDRVQYRGVYATVVFASRGDCDEEIAPGYEDYAGAKRGLILCDDDGTITELGEPDEDLLLMSPA